MDKKETTVRFNYVPGQWDTPVYECDSCGSLVSDYEAHAKFHSDIMYARDPKETP